MDVWGSRLDKLEEIPNPEIFEILKASYDSLPDDGDKNLFLDIACFFIGEEKSQVVIILNACDFHATVGLENLINRSLLTIEVNTNKIMMHQLLRDMGRAIVRQRSPYKPGKRCRLWHHRDSFNVLKQKMGTETVEGLRLDMDALKEDKVCLMSCNINYENGMEFETDAFTGMQSLRLLQINNVQLTGGYKQFPKNLKYLYWRRLPCGYLPRGFPLENLVAIDIRDSNITQLWTGNKVLQCVKILNLSHCQGIIKVPEFSQFPRLERLILKGCQSLVEVHESIVELEGLLLLDLHDCKSLRKLPNNIGKLKALETFIISGCSNLEELPTDLNEMECLKVFYADGISFRTSNSATKEETSFRSYIWSLVCKPKQVPILPWDSLPPSLISLSLANCNLSDDAFPRDFGGMPLLQNVDLSYNPICFLPDCVKHVRRLNKLRLFGCRSLKTVIGLPSIQDLRLDLCTLLEKVTFQTQWHPSSLASLSECGKLVDMEGIFKVVPIGKIDAEMLSYLCWQEYYLESMKSIKMFNRYTGGVNTGPIQGVYEYGGIFSIFLPGDSNVSSYFAHRTCGHSISLTVPSSSPNARIRGFNLRVVYAGPENMAPFPPIMAKIFNYTKSLQLDFYPALYAIPGEGEDIIWLSHWNFGSPHLEAGDEICLEMNFAKELAIHLEYEDQERMSAQSSSMVCYESWKED